MATAFMDFLNPDLPGPSCRCILPTSSCSSGLTLAFVPQTSFLELPDTPGSAQLSWRWVLSVFMTPLSLEGTGDRKGEPILVNGVAQ